ncbi:AcrR family transcriptional regulator [Streptomonospora nanhaiensis]|uniref:AcrR family transcriptional regulator n=1 Tax=Streptomonospora nanhaiensis TaxID=1323731 RepID=A0A853BI70_9ACTN|nr:TetR/AcrR family transcriptional regulator [Streptomonospora nanhaiensis]NYI95109.1 AcrR family transcriptional regulator [Streptomonospora nanhaiensis]
MPHETSGQVEGLRYDSACARPGGRTARTGKAVMDATIAELSEVGYAALRIESVAERAGVNKTTIYRRWGSKAGLVAAAFIERQGEVSPPVDTGDLRTDLLSFLREVRRAFESPWIAALIRETGPRSVRNDEIHEVLDQIWPARFALSRAIFTRAVERGDLPRSADPDFLVEAAAGPLYFRWLFFGRELTDDFLECTTELVLQGASRPRSSGAAHADGP